jgi:hypothetical protein
MNIAMVAIRFSDTCLDFTFEELLKLELSKSTNNDVF